MSASSSTLSFQSPLARMRGGFRDALVLALVAAATTWVALLSWKGFAIDYSGFMGPLIIIGVVVAVSGAVLRWLRVPGALLVLAQLVIVGMVVSLYLTGSLVPVGEAWLRLEEAFRDASETARQYIMIAASRSFQEKIVGSEALAKFSQRDELMAWSDLVNEEAENGDYNVFDGMGLDR